MPLGGDGHAELNESIFCAVFFSLVCTRPLRPPRAPDNYSEPTICLGNFVSMHNINYKKTIPLFAERFTTVFALDYVMLSSVCRSITTPALDANFVIQLEREFTSNERCCPVLLFIYDLCVEKI